MNKLNLILLTIFLSIFLFLIFSCGKEDEVSPSEVSRVQESEDQKDSLNPVNIKDNYWGCWKEATGKQGVYDITLTEADTGMHNITFSFDCSKNPLLSMDIGYFRNDTLILDNGLYEFWCYIQRDTLYYSVNNLGNLGENTEKFIKN